MKPYDKDIDIVFSPMSDETMSWLDELLTTCKRFGVDYYNASEKGPCICGSSGAEKLWNKAGENEWSICLHSRALLWDSSSGIKREQRKRDLFGPGTFF